MEQMNSSNIFNYQNLDVKDIMKIFGQLEDAKANVQNIVKNYPKINRRKAPWECNKK